MAQPRESEGIELKTEVLNKITKDIKAEEDKLFQKANVVGVGVGTKVTKGQDTGEPCVKVLVSQKVTEGLFLSPDDAIGKKVGETPSDVEEVGEIIAGDSGEVAPCSGEDVGTIEMQEIGTMALRSRIRPAEGGFSVGHYKITAGTIATAVYDSSPFPGIPSRYYILSNNHVLANSNDANVGDPILQPGPYDGGSYPQDVIAHLSRFVPIRFGGPSNFVDAAVAEGPFHWLDREIYWIGYVKGVRGNWPKIGEILQKTGRTTNYTTGAVMAIDATVNVNYGGNRVARFVHQILTKAMSAGGDSGSLVLDLNENAIGLLFAGSSSVTVMNHILYVQALLGIRVV